RDIAQRQRIADLDRCLATGHELVVYLCTLRRNDVTTLTVCVQQQGDMRGAIRIVLQALDAAGNAFLVALEVNDAVVLLGSAALVTRGDATVMVASTRLVLRFRQRRIRCALVQARRRNAD